jgi:predicted nucleic acid-binding protein
MAKSKKPIYCWDSTTPIAWLKGEQSAPLADIDLVVQEVDADEAIMIIPATVYSEILEVNFEPDQLAAFDAFLNRANVLSVDLTPQIARRAAAIRERGLAERPKRKLKTPDAQIAATAIAYGANVLHSLDDDLLHLNGHDTVDGLAICRPIPFSGQRGIDYR